MDERMAEQVYLDVLAKIVNAPMVIFYKKLKKFKKVLTFENV